jgi:hypothetical protein
MGEDAPNSMRKQPLVAVPLGSQRTARPFSVGVPFLALAVPDVERVAIVCEGQGRGIPAGGDESANRAMLLVGDADDGDGIVGVSDIQKLPLVIGQEGGRRRPFGSERSQGGREALENLQAPGIDHVDGVVVGAGNEETAVGRDLHIVRIHADVERADDLVGCRINDAYRFTGPVGDEQPLAIRREHHRRRIDLHRNAGHDGARLQVEDDHVARTRARAPVGHVEPMAAGQMGSAGPPDLLRVDRLHQIRLRGFV